MSLCTRSSWSVVRHQLTQHRAYQANSFFYSALLSRTWENSPLPELKQEAINRGLSPYVLTLLLYFKGLPLRSIVLNFQIYVA